MLANNGFTTILTNPFTFLAAALTGIGVNFITYFVIQFTSSLSMKILGTVRNIMMVVIGVLFYQEIISSAQILGYTISLCGFIAYNLSKLGYFDSSDPVAIAVALQNKTTEIDEDAAVDSNDLEQLLPTVTTHHLYGNNSSSSSLPVPSQV
jgi:hypothetical protein